MQDLYRNKSITVIGGGLAGLSAAVFLAEKGFNINLFEASPRLGGRVYSFFDKSCGLKLDNGQHILASWYKNTFEYLRFIGSYEKLKFQKQLEIMFADSSGRKYKLKAAKLPPPLHLAGGIMKYSALGIKDKLAVLRMVNFIKKNIISESELKESNTDRLFVLSRQTNKAIDYFWKPFIIAVFNAEPKNTSAFMFAEMISTGFIKKGGAELVLPNGFLSDIFIEPAVKFLENSSANIKTNNGISEIKFKDNAVTSIIAKDNTVIKSDFYISAVPFFNFNKLFNDEFLTGQNIILKSSPIVNIHLKFDKDIDSLFTQGFAGLLGTQSQWVFRVTKDQLCVVISSAAATAEMTKEDIIDLAVNELKKCIPEFKSLKVTSARVLKEMRATFVPDKDSLNGRPESKTSVTNLFLAGDWTNTGLPATIEGAVKSGKTASNEILDLIKS